MTCGNKVKWFDLIPVFSYISLRGKCRHCGTKLSVQYPVIESLNGLVYLGVFLYLGFSWEAVMISVLFSFMLIIGMIDYSHQIIPDKILVVLMVLSLIYVLVYSKTYVDSIIGFFAVSTLFYIIAVFSKMGGGDIKLMAVGGFLLGWKLILVALMIGSIIGSVIGLTLIGLKVIDRKQVVPYGPFLCSGIFIASLFGEELIVWYLNLVL